MAYPTFMVVGAQKSGTTWLFECLNEHPEVFVPTIKEVQFFSRPEDNRASRRHMGEAWYLGLFPETNSGSGYKATGELTPDYMYYPYVAEQLWAFNPELRIVFILRDPVERAYSAYWMYRRHKPDLPEFEELLRENPHFLARGLYHRQIARFLELFPAEQIRVYIYEEATRAPETVLPDLFAFLGVDPGFRPPSLNRKVGETRVFPPPFGFLFYRVASPMVNAAPIRPIWRWLRNRTGLKEWLFGALARGGAEQAYAPLSPDTRLRLAAQFAAENDRLFQLLGRRVPSWSTTDETTNGPGNGLGNRPGNVTAAG